MNEEEEKNGNKQINKRQGRRCDAELQQQKHIAPYNGMQRLNKTPFIIQFTANWMHTPVETEPPPPPPPISPSIYTRQSANLLTNRLARLHAHILIHSF